jgi:hypothetical protein
MLTLIAMCLALIDHSKQAPGEMGFNAPDKKKPATVAIFVYSGPETRPGFVTADRDLSNCLVRILQQRCPENHQYVRFIPPGKIEEFKNNHSDWHSMPLKELGKRFDADYVLYLEIESLSLYEKGSSNHRGDIGEPPPIGRIPTRKAIHLRIS